MSGINKKSSSENGVVKSADRVLDILSLLAQYPGGMKMIDISVKLKIPVSSLHALLNTIRLRGYIERQADSLIFRLSRKIYQLIPAPIQSDEDLISLAIPVMEKIHQKCSETVSLSVRIGDEIVFIGKRSSSSILQVVNALGSRLPAHATGSGKAILSNLSEYEIDQIYPHEKLLQVTPNTITSKTELKKVLALIRTLGYADDNEESMEGVWAVGACILSADGRPIAATSIVVPSSRVTDARKELWRQIIKEGASEITMNLGSVDMLINK